MGFWQFISTFFSGKVLNAIWTWGTRALLNRIRRRRLSKQAKTVAGAFDIFSSSRVKPNDFSIRKIGRIARRESEDIRNAWINGLDGILLIGEAGSGKSGIAHNLAYSLQARGSPVLFIDASEVPSHGDPTAHIRNLLPIDLGLVEAFSLLGKEQECYFIVDQLDSIVETEALSGLISLIKVLASLPGVRVLVVSRTYEAEENAQIKGLDLARVCSYELRRDSAEAYLSKIGIVAPSTTIAELAQNLLNLSIIAEIAAANGSFARVTGEIELWERYLDTIKNREGEEVLREAFRLAFDNLRGGASDFPASVIPKPEIRRLISRGILVRPSFLRLRFRHERLQEFLCAYRMLPERPSAIEVYCEFGELRGRRVAHWLHSLLHLHDQEDEARFVDEMLSHKDDLPFYFRAVVLDNLREQRDPSRVIVKVLVRHLDNEAYEKYFFSGQVNRAWTPLLHEERYFSNPPEPEEVQPGSYRFRSWFAGDHLIRVAREYPEIVVDVASTVQSRNGYVLDKILEALLQIPAGLCAGAVQNISKWVPSFRRFFAPVKLGEFMRHLSESGHILEALCILDALLTPAVPEVEASSERMRLRLIRSRSRVDEYWLKEIWRAQGVKIIALSPKEAIRVLEGNLVLSIELEQEAYGEGTGSRSTSAWRSAIEDHPQNTSIHPLNDLLVDGIRDALFMICSEQAEQGEQLLSKYLSSNHSILRRIAIHALRSFGKQYPNLLQEVFSRRSTFEDHEIHHELYWLLANQFMNLPEESRGQIIDWLFEGPQDTGAIAKWIEQREGAERLEEELLRYKKHWTLRRIWGIRKWLEGQDKERLEEFINELGEPDHPDFLAWHSEVTFVKQVTPLSADQMKELSLEEIVGQLKSYVPPSASIEHSREGLAVALKAATSEEPVRFAELSSFLMDGEIRFVYTYHYLCGMRESIERGKKPDLALLLDLCEFVSRSEEDPFIEDRGDHEAGLRAAQLEVARLLGTLLKQENADLDNALLNRVRSIISLLLQNPDPKPDTEEMGGWDPATRSLNSVRGQAMHDLLQLALYIDRKKRGEAGKGEHQPSMDPFVQAKLEKKLDKKEDASLSVHSVFGWYFPHMHYLDRDWTNKHLQLIFPENPEFDTYWRAAWDAYVSFNRVYQDVFTALMPLYRHAISLIGEPEHPNRFGTTKAEKLAEHLAFAYIHELIDLDSEDRLIEDFYGMAEDKLRGHIAFWLVRAFRELKLGAESPVLRRMSRLMQWRINAAADSDDIENCQEEISSFMRWLEHVPVGFGEMGPLIKKAVPFLKDGYHKKLVADYLAAHCDRFPLESVEILHRMLLLAETGWFSLYKESVGVILKAAIESRNEDAKDEAILVINLLGERGDFRWKGLLPPG